MGTQHPPIPGMQTWKDPGHPGLESPCPNAEMQVQQICYEGGRKSSESPNDVEKKIHQTSCRSPSQKIQDLCFAKEPIQADFEGFTH